jgi:multidrug efflux pump subunit AcrB
MLSHFFIDRPIFAAVISIIIMIAGGVALFGLPIGQYPEITPSQIQVSATYSGANADQAPTPTLSRRTSPRPSSSKSTARMT